MAKNGEAAGKSAHGAMAMADARRNCWRGAGGGVAMRGQCCTDTTAGMCKRRTAIARRRRLNLYRWRRNRQGLCLVVVESLDDGLLLLVDFLERFVLLLEPLQQRLLLVDQRLQFCRLSPSNLLFTLNPAKEERSIENETWRDNISHA